MKKLRELKNCKTRKVLQRLGYLSCCRQCVCVCVNIFICDMHADYLNLISLENIFQAWGEFRKGKTKRLDVQELERNLEDNLFALQQKLKSRTYRHGSYQSFYVNDPKQRHIHKASVADRVVHHLLYTFLYKLFDSSFIYDSYSCRLDKGTHKAVTSLVKFTGIVGKNHTSPCWALKLDIKKFFASVDHEILLSLFKEKIKDEDIIWLLEQVIGSFCTCHQSEMLKLVQHDNDGNHKGMPLGNLTSQVFANIYLNELDQFVKHKLKVKHYLRYADDFLFLAKNKDLLHKHVDVLRQFLSSKLKLELHPDKVIFRKLDWGVDFLGYIVLPHYILPRTKTRKRIFKKLISKFEDVKKGKITDIEFNQTLQSYLGYLSHSNSFKVSWELKNQIPFGLFFQNNH